MKLIKLCLIVSCFVFSINISAEQIEAADAYDQKVKQEETLSDGQVMDQLILNIESIELKIKTNFDDLSSIEGDKRSLMGVKILEFDKDITREMDSALSQWIKIKEQGGQLDKYTLSLHRHLNRRNKQLNQIFKFVQSTIDKLIKKSSSVQLNDRFVVEQDINKSRLILSDILLNYQGIIEAKAALGVDYKHDKRVLADLLLNVSGESSSRLKLVSAQIDNKKNEISSSSEEGKKNLEIGLNALIEKRNGITDGLSLAVTLMEKHDLDTTKLSQLLITSSGTINQQIFDKAVIMGLVAQWQDEFEKWLMLNASSFIVTSVIIVLILLIFRLISVLAGKLFIRGLDSSKVGISKLLREFFVVSVRRIVMFIGVLIALSQTGVELGPLLAGLGVLGFVVGFALQGVLSNFASGMMILIYRPYDVGDVVEIAGVKGTVKEMSMVSTTLLSFSNERLVVPNNNIWGNLIRNITSETTRRVDLVFKISFDADIEQIEKIFIEEVNKVTSVLSRPEPIIELHKQHETHLEFIVRPWVETSDYWSTYWGLIKSIQLRMNKEGVPKLNPYEFLKPLISKV